MLQVQGKDGADTFGFSLVDVQSSATGIEIIAEYGHATRPLTFAAGSGHLSRVRSAIISRSNWAKESKTLSTSRPIEVAVLNRWVMETKETPCCSKVSIILAKSRI
jgi:hypothetical protein